MAAGLSISRPGVMGVEPVNGVFSVSNHVGPRHGRCDDHVMLATRMMSKHCLCNLG
jgi:hypothetical protein